MAALHGTDAYEEPRVRNPCSWKSITQHERKSHEACSPLSKPIALSQELQTKLCSPNPPGEAQFLVSPGALRFETANQNLGLTNRGGSVMRCHRKKARRNHELSSDRAD